MNAHTKIKTDDAKPVSREAKSYLVEMGIGAEDALHTARDLFRANYYVMSLFANQGGGMGLDETELVQRLQDRALQLLDHIISEGGLSYED